MLSEYYTLKEIILGLRKEYLDNEEKLISLKKYCFVNTDKINDYNFRVINIEGKKPDILCDYEIKSNNKKKDKKEFEKVTSGLYHDNNGEYIFGGNINALYINDSDLSLFKDIVEDILNSNFNNNIKLPSVLLFEDNRNSSFTITHNGIYFDTFLKNNKETILYLPKDDTINIHSTNKKELIDVRDLLNLKIYKHYLNLYHINSIENSNTLEKELTTPLFEFYHKVKYSIVEAEEQIILKQRIKF